MSIRDSIRIGGTDIRDMKRETLLEWLWYVLQDTWLRSGTIRDNIRMGQSHLGNG